MIFWRSLTERPKQGFGMSMAHWLLSLPRDWAEALLSSADLDSARLSAGVECAVWKDRLSEIWTLLMYRELQDKWKRGRA